MASLIAKKLSKLPIGTQVEVTYGDGASHHEIAAGIITDSDFSANIEITTLRGEEIVLDFSIVRGVQVTKALPDILKELSEGTKVRFSYGTAEQREPVLSGTVTENDNEENVEIKTASGEELVLNYSLIQSLLVQSKGIAQAPAAVAQVAPAAAKPVPVAAPVAQPKAAVLLHTQEPGDYLNASDNKLKDLFDQIPLGDRKKLGSVFDSFKYGVKMNDKSKMTTAANQARQILYREDDQGYYWTTEAVMFCGYLLRRVNAFDCDVFLVGECFKEAAYMAWKAGEYAHAGAYAILALLEGAAGNLQDLLIILAGSVVKSGDASGLPILCEKQTESLAPRFKELVGSAFAAKGVQVTLDQDPTAELNLLATLYTGTEMAEEVQYWLPEEEKAAPAAAQPQPAAVKIPEPQPEAPAKPAEPELLYGRITRLSWSEKTGTLTGDDGNAYTFRYQDIEDPNLLSAIQACMRSDLGGKTYMVKFYAQKNAAKRITPDTALVDRARAISVDPSREDRFEAAYALCKEALDTSDIRRALGDLVKYATAIYNAKKQVEFLKEALSLYEKHITYYPANAFAVIAVAQAYGVLKQYPQMLEHGEKALAVPGLNVKQKITLISHYLTMLRDYYELCRDKTLLNRFLELTDELRQAYPEDFATDRQVQQLFTAHLLHHRVFAACGLDRLEQAEEEFAQLAEGSAIKNNLVDLMARTRDRLTPKEEEPEPLPEQIADEEPNFTQTVEEDPDEDEDDLPDDYDEEIEEGIEEEILPYTDADGWEALKLTKAAVVDYALHIGGEARIPAILAYLRAGAMLNERIVPVYRTVALAANDPMQPQDYSITALVTALEAGDSEYPVLNDCCMAAAFLRASFLSGRGYDYTAQGLRSSISVSQQIPALSEAYDTLEEFRKEVGWAIDIYADYRNQGVKKLKADLDATVRHAEELYTKFVAMPAREDAKFARLLETKKLLFAKDGYLATMLQHILDRNSQALENERENFIHNYLGDSNRFSAKQVSEAVIDGIIAASWDQAGKSMQVKKATATLQGNRRNNLRSSVSDVLSTICRWYALSEQSAGLTWRTEQGEAAYLRLRPQLMEQLDRLSEDSLAEMESCPDPEMVTGLFLLAATAQELSARLDGSWKFDQEKYLYADFLRGNHIMLGRDFMPELSSTFCVLPEFNVLARIRRHVEDTKLSFQAQIDEIYGTDKSCNNYGTAARILEYLEAMGGEDAVCLPENADRFLAHTEMQIDMRYRSFRETYALAMNYGQIIKSDAFCYTLEDTVRYWYAFCKESKNYGFFTNILLQAEEQIHASARQYEAQLDEQLDALIASNQPYFDLHPDYAEAIRAQIVNQNFTVAEDWMARIRIGDFSLDVQQPEALGYLESFWNSYVVTYNRVADASRQLSTLLGRRDARNKDSKRAQQMIDSWLSNGHPSNPERIGQLLNLLGWQNIQVSPYQFAAERRGEFYEVRMASSTAGLTTPLHPIAAYGSSLEKKRMYVSCLYGIYDCDRLYEKMRALDVIDGSKIILLDYALGQADRRALARTLKKRESGLRNVNMVIDRVLITHLANNYNENLINRILMATAMPFSYCQPYVVESVHTMPPEIFIGRKDELLKIEQADGVNLIYGGRQLGKSALFKKALADLDGRQQQRAVLIDIKELDCASAARKLSTKLIDLNITPDGEITDDWDVLCRNIERRLRSSDEEISYFLLMLDEADAFINDCANCGYRPLVALKDVQQSLPGQFKYVLAGLHNIVKFNRQVALGNNSVITHMPSLKITPFRTPEAQELLTGPLSYLGFSLPSKVTVSQILATCNYFPGLIQLYAKKLIESIRAADYAGYDVKKTPPYVVSDEHLRRVMSDKEFVDQIHEKFEITLTLDQDQGSCYYPLTLLIGWMYNVMPSKSGYTAQDVLHHAKDLSVYPLAELDEEKIDALLLELQDLNILRSVSNNSYLLASKNFRDLLGSDEEIFEKLMKIGGAVV